MESLASVNAARLAKRPSTLAEDGFAKSARTMTGGTRIITNVINILAYCLLLFSCFIIYVLLLCYAWFRISILLYV